MGRKDDKGQVVRMPPDGSWQPDQEMDNLLERAFAEADPGDSLVKGDERLDSKEERVVVQAFLRGRLASATDYDDEDGRVPAAAASMAGAPSSNSSSQAPHNGAMGTARGQYDQGRRGRRLVAALVSMVAVLSIVDVVLLTRYFDTSGGSDTNSNTSTLMTHSNTTTLGNNGTTEPSATEPSNTAQDDGDAFVARVFNDVTLDDGTKLAIVTDDSGEAIKVSAERVGSLVSGGNAVSGILEIEHSETCAAYRVLDDQGEVIEGTYAIRFSDSGSYFEAVPAEETE